MDTATTARTANLPGLDFAITPDMVRDASIRIRVLAHKTPVMTSRLADERAGRSIFFKCENLQRGGSFKIRGATNKILSIPAADLQRGVVAFSSGNHAQAVAIASEFAGARATIVMPRDAPRSKVDATAIHGANIVAYDRFKESREEIASRLLDETGATLVPPYDDPFIMAGQGTAALELLDQVPDLDALVICAGGGGLISGCSMIAKELNPSIRIFGVEPELASDVYQSVAEGHRVTIPPPQTIADGLRTPSPGKLTFPVIQQLVERIVLVSEDEIREAVRFLVTRLKVVVEPSGAVAAAAALFRKIPQELGRVGVIISGGNVDLDFLASLS